MQQRYTASQGELETASQQLKQAQASIEDGTQEIASQVPSPLSDRLSEPFVTQSRTIKSLEAKLAHGDKMLQEHEAAHM